MEHISVIVKFREAQRKSDVVAAPACSQTLGHSYALSESVAVGIVHPEQRQSAGMFLRERLVYAYDAVVEAEVGIAAAGLVRN